MSLVSVLVLTYGHEDTLRQSIASILAQNLGPKLRIEIVIALDKSPDGTADVAYHCASENPNVIRVVSGPQNIGMMENLRRGLSHCRGEFIGFCEGDDYWTEPSKIARQVKGLKDNSRLLVSATSGQKLYPNGKCLVDWKLREGDGCISTSDVMKRNGIAVPTASLLWRIAALRELPEWLFKAPVADVFLLLAGMRSDGLWYVDRASVAYRIDHAGSWSEKAKIRTEAEIDLFAQQMIEAYLASCDSFAIDRNDLKSRLAHFNRVRCEIALDRGEWKLAIAQGTSLPTSAVARMVARRIHDSLFKPRRKDGNV